MGSDALLREEESVAAPTETGSDLAKRGSEQAGSSPEGLPPSGLAIEGDSQPLPEESAVGEGEGWEWDVIDDSSEGGGEAGSEEGEGSRTRVSDRGGEEVWGGVHYNL